MDPETKQLHEQRVLYLDGLRALAIIMVVIQHYSPAGSFFRLVPVDWGLLGVHLFFVLSGYLITCLLSSRYSASDGAARAYGRFWVSRSFRIIPPALLSLAFISLFDFPAKSLNYFLINGLFLTNFWTATQLPGPPYTGHFWSLAVEMQFYVLYPFLFWVLPRRRRIEGLIIVMVATYAALPLASNLLGFANPGFLLPWRIDAFLLGGIVACIGDPEARRSACTVLVAAGALFLASQIATKLVGVPFGWPTLSVVNIVFGGLVGGIAFWPRVANVLSWTPLVYIGRISYGIYVWHLVVPLLYPKLVTLLLGLSVPAGSISWWGVNLASTVVISALSWRLIEQPLILTGKRLLNALWPVPAVRPVVERS